MGMGPSTCEFLHFPFDVLLLGKETLEGDKLQKFAADIEPGICGAYLRQRGEA
jgi:hypothetical protein